MVRWSIISLAALSFVACSSDWDLLDPRLSTGESNDAGGGAGGSPPSGGDGVGAGAVGGTGTGGAAGGTGGAVSGTGGSGGVGPPMCNGEVVPELASGMTVAGSTAGAETQLEATCTGTTGGERVYALVLPASADVVVTTDLAGTTFDAVLHIREVCEDVATEVACDDVGNGDTITLPGLAAGTYFVIVDSHSTTGEGDFELLATW